MFDLHVLESVVNSLGQFAWGWPFLSVLLGTGIIATFLLGFVQIRYFFTSWKLLLTPVAGAEGAEITPLQAFLGTLGSTVGNGHITGMAMAVALGGPGAAFWVLVAGFLGMAVRFCEVYAAICVVGTRTIRGMSGGPMVYLSMVPGGRILPYIYAIFIFFYFLAGSNAAQANCISESIVRTWPSIDVRLVALVLAAFLVYAVLGGAQRFLRLSDRLTPFKVFVFLASSLAVLVYHWAAIIPTLVLIFKSAFSMHAFVGGAAGFTLQQAIRNGLSRALNASEVGLGTAALFFGASGGKRPVQDSLMSMAGVFVSSFVVCFTVTMVLISSGVWANGEIGPRLVVSAFETLFGQYGGWVTSFIAVSFGLGVMVSSFFIARKTWLFLTNNRFEYFFRALVCAIAFVGAIVPVRLVWSSLDLIMIVLIVTNVYGVAWFMPTIVKGLWSYRKN